MKIYVLIFWVSLSGKAPVFESAFVGSNPTAPAKNEFFNKLYFYYLYKLNSPSNQFIDL